MEIERLASQLSSNPVMRNTWEITPCLGTPSQIVIFIKIPWSYIT